MTGEPQPTIEELQAQLLELKQQNEKSAVRIQELETSNKSLNDNLNESRALNAKLFKALPAGGEDEYKKKEEEHIETQEEFFDSFINPAVEKITGVKNDE